MSTPPPLRISHRPLAFCQRGLFALLLASAFAHTARAEPVDLELVLAIDASSSVDIGEYALQLRGIASAFRDPDIWSAIRSGRRKSVAVNVIVWAQRGYDKLSTGWTVVRTPQDAGKFAQQVEGLPRRQFGGTAIGEGIAAALAAINGNAIEGERLVIDVSGDGRESEETDPEAVLLPDAHVLAGALGVTINGLAIVDGDPGLHSYYFEHVRFGSNSFVIPADNYLDFTRAMKLKLFREIQDVPRLAHHVENR